jgi:hypothetical protein
MARRKEVLPNNVPPFLQFLKIVLDHSPLHGHPLTFDLFARYSFPSEASQSFASIIFEKLSTMGASGDTVQFIVDFSNLILDMWTRCLSEKYHSPIYDLVALLSFTLQLHATSVAPRIVTSLLPAAQTTIFLLATPRYKSADGDLSNHPEKTVRQLYADIDASQSLSLMYLSALGCLSAPPANLAEAPDVEALNVPSSNPQAEFWKAVQLEFLLVMLTPKQPESDLLVTLALLRTSVTPTSIGPIVDPLSRHTSFTLSNFGPQGIDMNTPEFIAKTVINSVSSHLTDPPQYALSGSANQIHMRLAALHTLMAFATSPFGALQIARNDLATPRLVTVLSWALDRLYDNAVPDMAWTLDEITSVQTGSGGPARQDAQTTQDMEIYMPGRGSEPEPQIKVADDSTTYNLANMLCRLISEAVHLLHTLVTDPEIADKANIAEKLALSHGGSQRHLLTLARLNFAEEDLVMEVGIDAETVELAHELLELAVTPDEGEGVGEVFAS